MINGGTALVGLLGNPVRHSLSPAMHNAALAELGLNWRYLALPCEQLHLRDVLDGLHAVGCRGLNVTIPHKQAVAGLCRKLSPLACRLGAVNTLIPDSGSSWTGSNTDVNGFLAPLETHIDWTGRRAVVVGCGGSARAVVAGLQTLHLAAISVIGRQTTTLQPFVQDLNLEEAPLDPLLDSDPSIADVVAASDLIVNTTPVGMAQHGEAGAMPMGESLWSGIKTEATLYDLIYTPRPTAWLQWGRKRQLHCIDGLEMLVQQGAASLRLWSGHDDVPVDAMRSAAETALKT
jgi:shikimate dehydrogenase